VFVKTQGSLYLETVPSQRFVYVPGLNDAFYVTQNTLFKMTLQAVISNDNGKLDQFVQILVNDHLIIGNKTIPNTEKRINYGLGDNLWDVDTSGGFYYSSGLSLSVPIMRVTFVYLAPGIYTFNVGTRSAYSNGLFRQGIVTFELTQFENGSLTSVGGYNLVSVPRYGPLDQNANFI
jgi:hypothetical protein